MNITKLKLYISKIEESDFEQCHKILKEKELIKLSKIFLYYLTDNNKYSPNKFLTCFLISKHYKEIFDNFDDQEKLLIEISSNLVKATNNLLNNMNKYCTKGCDVSYNLEYLRSENKELIEFINKYYSYFDKWKKTDEIKLINNLIKAYWELEINIFHAENDNQHVKTETNTLENNKKILTIQKEQGEIINKIKQIGGEDGIQHFNNFVPVFFDEKYFNNLFKQITDNYHKAYWDILRQELENNDFNGVLKILKEIKTLFKNLLPNSNKFHIELDEYMDIDFIAQLINNNVFDKNNLDGIVSYIISNLKKLQSPSDDKDTENWEKEVKEILDKGESYANFLPSFFKVVLDKLIKINNQVKIIKDSELYNNIKELKK